MSAERHALQLYEALGYHQMLPRPEAMFAGFVPDLSMPPFRDLEVTDEWPPVEFALVTRRVLHLTDHQDTAMRINLFVGANSGVDARFAMASELADFSRRLRLEPGDRLGIRVGDFTTLVDGSPGGPALLAFGRENVVVLMRDEGPQRTNLVSAARVLDDQLGADPRYDVAAIADLAPRIDALYIDGRQVDEESSIPLIVRAVCPQGYELRYRFATTHGSVNRVGETPPRFSYQTGRAAGPQTITAFVTSLTGLTRVRRLDLSVGLGDLGYRPGA